MHLAFMRHNGSYKHKVDPSQADRLSRLIISTSLAARRSYMLAR